MCRQYLYGVDGEILSESLGPDADGWPIWDGTDEPDRPLIPDDSPADPEDLPLWPPAEDERWWAERTRDDAPWYLPLLAACAAA